MTAVHVTATRTGQAPPLAGLLLLFAGLGLALGGGWAPAWLLVAGVALWVGWER